MSSKSYGRQGSLTVFNINNKLTSTNIYIYDYEVVAKGLFLFLSSGFLLL